MREQILLSCTGCRSRWYSSTKNKKNTPDRLELKKYCKFCQRRTIHKEVK